MTCRKGRGVHLKTMEFTGIQNFDGAAGEETTNMEKLAYKALVFMFTSLTDRFCQPIGMFGAKGATNSNVLAPLLLQAIIKVEMAGGKVHAFVADGASTNRSMWTEFGISGKIESTRWCFENPCDPNRSIYALSNAPHSVKCVRNRLQEQRQLKVCFLILFIKFVSTFLNVNTCLFQTPDGYVEWRYYRQLYEVDNGLLKSCPKLTVNHVYVSHQLKMRVYLAIGWLFLKFQY